MTHDFSLCAGTNLALWGRSHDVEQRQAAMLQGKRRRVSKAQRRLERRGKPVERAGYWGRHVTSPLIWLLAFRTFMYASCVCV
jgi:hypothetical protein